MTIHVVRTKEEVLYLEDVWRAELAMMRNRLYLRQ